MTNTLRAGANHPPLVFENHSQDSRYTGPLDKSQTVSATYGTGGNNQPLVVQKPKTLKIRSGCEGGGKGALIQDDKSATLGTHNDQTLFQPTYSSSKVSLFTEATEELASTYIVRRLTPTECARLQGFPDWWCADLGEENPTDDEIAFWRDVFETHRMVVTGAKKPKTDNQIRKWLKDPYSDSAAYKLWGNGVALPCVHFVLAGIVYYSQLESGGKLIAEVKA